MGIGDRILNKIDELDITQKAFAEQLNISYSTLNGYVKTNREPDFETLKRIADALDVTCDYLLDFNPKNPQNISAGEFALIEDIRTFSDNQKELLFGQIEVMKKQNKR